MKIAIHLWPVVYSLWWGYVLYGLIDDPSPLRGVTFGLVTVGLVYGFWTAWQVMEMDA